MPKPPPNVPPASTPEPPGGRARERLKDFERERIRPEEEKGIRPPPDPQSETDKEQRKDKQDK